MFRTEYSQNQVEQLIEQNMGLLLFVERVSEKSNSKENHPFPNQFETLATIAMRSGHLLL